MKKEKNILSIKNFGPIKHGIIIISKYNIIIGPQSSGKSCILKIASFCSWLEKRIELSQQPDKCLDESTFDTALIQFHKLEGYLKPDSEIKYETKFLSFTIKNDKKLIFEFKWKRERWNYQRPQIIYIPAERNIVSVIPNWFDIKLKENNIKNYMADWEEAHKQFLKNNKQSILDVGVSYYYDVESKTDKILLDNDKSLDFVNASSGLQSMIPLYVLIKYMTENIFDSQIPQSLAYNMEYKGFLDILDKELNVTKYKKKEEIKNNYSATWFSEIFLEEPEENIFPQTQYELVKWIVKQMGYERNNKMFISTHSPYILSSFNNLIQAGDVVKADKSKIQQIKEILNDEVYIDYDEINVYTIANGCVKSIKDNEDRLIVQSALDSASDNISNDFSKLLEL